MMALPREQSQLRQVGDGQVLPQSDPFGLLCVQPGEVRRRCGATLARVCVGSVRGLEIGKRMRPPGERPPRC